MKVRNYIAILIYMAGLILVPSCDVHEFPYPPVQFVLNLNYDTEMPLYKVVDYTEQRTKSVSEEYDIRYIVNVYDGKDEDSREAIYHFVFTKDDVSELGHSVTMPILKGDYRFVVWTDYVAQGSDSDLYYNTERFEYLSLAEGRHVGSNDMRDAFAGMITATVSPSSTSADVEMKRPMGKFNFIAVDARDYDLDGCSVVFGYNGFMPSAYNMHAVKPADSRTGVRFDSSFRRIDEDEAELGFDYVFVNGKETVVSVFIEIYDPAGKLLSRSKPVDVPLVRSKLTTVKANFLTSKAGGGVSIIPDYEGDHNIVIDP